MFSGHGLEGGAACIGPRQEIVDFAIGMAVDDFGDDVGEIGEGIDAAELARLDQRGDNRPMLAAAVGAREQSILAIERYGRMLRSTTLESISMRPSPMKRVRPAQRDSA